jgi:hypothetical protein
MSTGSEGRRSTATTWTRPIEAVGLFVRGHTVRTACPTALVVGSVLSMVNQGAVILEGAATLGTWVRVGVNYLVPFLVASVGFLSARRTPNLPRRRPAP